MRTVELHDTRFEALGEGGLDRRHRLSLAKVVNMLRDRFGDVEAERLHFTIHYNHAGEILLVPETTIPLREVWLHRNHTALKSVLAGIEQAEQGQLVDRGSFARYADDSLDEENE